MRRLTDWGVGRLMSDRGMVVGVNHWMGALRAFYLCDHGVLQLLSQ